MPEPTQAFTGTEPSDELIRIVFFIYIAAVLVTNQFDLLRRILMDSTFTHTIAIADDHPHMRNSLAVILTFLGYHVIADAENGKDLIRKIGSSSIPSICILDLQMPEMDGFETIQYIKHRWPSVKILVYSLQSDKASKDRAFEKGADAYLVKGVELQELSAVLASLVV